MMKEEREDDCNICLRRRPCVWLGDTGCRACKECVDLASGIRSCRICQKEYRIEEMIKVGERVPLYEGVGGFWVCWSCRELAVEAIAERERLAVK